VKPILWRASLRHLQRHPWQLSLAILGVGLGVAVMIAIDVASGSAQRAFELSSSTLTGKATHSIEGGVEGLPGDVYRRIRLELGIRPVAPIVESYVVPTNQPERSLLLLGIDPFAEGEFRPYLAGASMMGLDLATFLTTPGTALMAAAGAAELGIEVGDRLDVDVGGRVQSVQLLGFLPTPDESRRLAMADLLIVDIATAQELLGLEDRLTRIDLRIDDGDEAERTLAEVRGILPGDVQLVTAATRNQTASQMTRAFRLNLQALSLLGLLCGAFLIYNTMTFAVVQRRQLMATLRALGTTRRQILTLVLGEALLVGLLGVMLGEIVGWALGKGLVSLVTRTINDLYFVLNVRQVSVEPWTLAKGALIGLGTTVAAALAPSWEASSTAPRAALSRSELESRVHRALPITSAVGVSLVLLGTLLLFAPGRYLLPAFAGLFSVLMGLALLTPLATLAFMHLLTPLAGRLFGQLGRVATRGVAAALSRTGIAVAALMVALSVTVGVDLMIRSFRSTVTEWLEYTLPADLYISVFTTQARRYSTVGSTMEPEAFAALSSLPDVAGANALRHFTASINDTQSRAIAIDLDPLARGVFHFKEGDPAAAWEPFAAGQAIIVSEPLAYRTGIRAGQEIELATPAGPRLMKVAGVYFDYSSEQGVLFLDRDLYRRLWGDDNVTAISLHAEPGTDMARLEDSVRATLGPGNRAQVISNGKLRERSLEIFDRTFVITEVLRTLAIVVAFVGVLSSLMALQLERTRELGVLRACGLTPGQLWRLVTQQTGLMGLVAGILSLPVGIIMAAIMIFIINRRSFGWSLQMEISLVTLGQALIVAVVAALLAGCYPAWRMSRTSPAESLREE
jgi:putative ABC transport system permease protein